MQDLEKYIIELLHIDDLTKNKLLDIYATGTSTYLLYKEGAPDNRGILSTIISLIQTGRRDGIEQMSTLRGSAMQPTSTTGGDYENAFDWKRADGDASPKELNDFIEKLYREDIGAKGNNPLFLGIGALKWQATRSEGEVFDLTSPCLIVPIQPVRLGVQSAVSLKYVEDDVYVNPCLYHALKQYFGVEAVRDFPLPAGSRSVDEPIDMLKLNIRDYLAAMKSYVASLKTRYEHTGALAFIDDSLAIAAYRHTDYCMYYDIRRNMDKLKSSDLAARIFGEIPAASPNPKAGAPITVLSYDKTQQEILSRVVAGDNLVIQGPPGSGKTHTIVNMIASLIAQKKRVLFVSTKVPALAEVYKKMPDELQCYLLPLFVESEQGAVASSEVRDLHKSLADAYEAETAPTPVPVHDKTVRQRNQAMETLSRHFDFLFTPGRLLGQSVYENLDEYFSHSDIDPIHFLSREELFSLNWQSVNDAALAVEKAARSFSEITHNDTTKFADSAWQDMIPEYRDFDKVNENIGDCASKLDKAMDAYTAYADYRPVARQIPVSTLTWLAHNSMTVETIETILKDENREAHYQTLADAYYTYQLSHESADYAIERGARTDLEAEVDVHPDLPALDLPTTLISNVASNPLTATLVSPEITPFLEAFFATARTYTAHEHSIREALDAFTYAFSKNCLDDLKHNKALSGALKELQKCNKKEKSIAFSAKTISLMRTLSHRADVSEEALVSAITNLEKYLNEVPEQETCLADLNNKLRSNGISLTVTGENLIWLNELQLAWEACSTTSILDFLANAPKYWNAVKETAAAVGLADKTDGMTTAELRRVVAGCNVVTALNLASLSVIRALGIETTLIPAVFTTSYLSVVETANAAKENFAADEDLTETVIALRAAAVKTEKDCGITGLYNGVRRFLLTHYPEGSYHYIFARKMTPDALTPFVRDLFDRALFEHTELFHNTIAGVESIRLMNFFAPFIAGDRRDHLTHGFPSILRHSIISQALSVVIRPEPALETALADAARTEQEMLDQNVADIAAACRASIPRGQAFEFLKTKSKYRYLRTYFKEKADEILALKRCFIMSPSAVSVLLRSEAYMNFDVVILDEASQVPPAYSLPVFIRAKQCVLVGDIYQMPYIRNFVSRRADASADMADEYERVDSVLDLVNRHESFSSTMLQCHFRSHTESLIAYSQRRYYPSMLTFPSPDPLGDDKGFYDYRVDGYTIRRRGSSSAENRVEAEKVVELLTKHFARYYDAEQKILTRSVGVIAFGEKQVSLIRSLIDSTPELAGPIRTMEAEGDVNAERYFFLKAIQRAQGMETDDLILSVTYGRIYDTERGTYALNPHWGELNRDVGEKVFNVAVTRGRMSVSVIHSVDAEELTDSLGYIREYLLMVRDFVNSQNTENGFVSRPLNNHFVDDVVNELVNMGIPRERMVVGYGVTDASYTIPIAILSADKMRAEAGILCEVPHPASQSYLDYTVRYPGILTARGWKTSEGENKLLRVFICDWFRDKRKTSEDLQQSLIKIKVIY